jgi:RNA polymerase sigma-70 factor (ECF subfamily)
MADAPSESLYELDTPENLALTEELGPAVNAAVEALPDEQRTAIWLREFQGLSYPQVGAAMSCPVGTVRSRIFRARDAIHQHLRHIDVIRMSCWLLKLRAIR